jgi:stalled ribosome alternative rescue factor ArfA
VARKAEPIRQKKLRRDPHARALGTPLFRVRVTKKPGAYRRRPKHRKREDGD